jgi:uncharacterized RDD family membrane protein YckC
MYDNTYTVETPEGTDLKGELAGPVVRVLAFATDLVIRGIILFGLHSILSWFGDTGIGIFLILMFILEWFYPVLFERFNQGKTPGKAIFGLRVVHDDLTPVGWGPSVLRNLLRAVDFMPAFYVFGITSMAVSRHFQRLGDLAAGTLVIHQSSLDMKRKAPKGVPLQPPVTLTSDEQIALIEFALRHEQLSKDRQKELGEHLAAVVYPDQGAPEVQLQRMGLWLLGAR